jgi:CRP-like cAMP-binding protein
MPEDKHLHFVRQSLLFEGVDDRMIERALQRAYTKYFEAGTQIIRQGDPALAFYILTQGYAKLAQVTPDGHEIVGRFVGPGQEFGAIAALSGATYPLSAQTLDRCEVLVWAGEVLAQLMEYHPPIAFNILRLMVERNQQTQQRYQELLTENVAQRVANALLTLLAQAGIDTGSGILIDIPFSEEDLAELTGTTVFSVSRILNQWQRNGWVALGRKRIQVMSQQALESTAKA